MSGRDAIAIVGMACEYPDARTPEELFENVMAGRRAFRRIPDERLPLDDYASDDPEDVDHTTVRMAALLEGWRFDRVRFKVVGSTYRSADPAHWLALDVADRALRDAGFAEGEGLPRTRTGVVLGNTLTGEFSRAQAMRLRWPFVRDALRESLAAQGIGGAPALQLLETMEARYKAPFEPFGDESLAGGLANTIAGRICNHFDLGGGGFTVDGACSSSLLAIAQSCSALVAGDADVMLAGGVALSLDPFELVGFARTGALADREMRVYDERREGFWPGEGCGVVVLMREADARARALDIHASIRGWAVASDGRGGISRPEAAGQLRALERAYERAGFGAEGVHYFEGHGTGTVVGDETELGALDSLLARAGIAAERAKPVGSLKANIGHTKAASGIAGLIKAVGVVSHRLIPPQVACERPHPLVDPQRGARLRVATRAEALPGEGAIRAGISSMGFGGIDLHVVIESSQAAAGARTGSGSEALAHRSGRRAAEAEVIAIAARDEHDFARLLDRLAVVAPRISRAELRDLAAHLAARSASTLAALGEDALHWRASMVARRPEEVARGVARLGEMLAGWRERQGSDTSAYERLDTARGVHLRVASGPARIGLLFPGQAAPVRRELSGLDELAEHELLRRLAAAHQRALDDAPTAAGPVDTAIAQPAIIAASLLGARVLEAFGVQAEAALGHSVGEIGALAWAGALSDEAAVSLAQTRGGIMSRAAEPGGTMLGVAADAETLAVLMADHGWRGAEPAWAAFNGPRRQVLSGAAPVLERFARFAEARGVHCQRLEVSHAFHSPHMAPCVEPLREAIQSQTASFALPERAVFSTRTGKRLDPHQDLAQHLAEQLEQPVRFAQALGELAAEVSLLIEVGPGRMLTSLVGEGSRVPVVAMDIGGEGRAGLEAALAAAFAAGADLDWPRLFEGRAVKPFDLEADPLFLANPCARSAPPPLTGLEQAPTPAPSGDGPSGALALLRERLAERCELPIGAIGEHDRFLSDLHLTSIAVGELAASVAQALGKPPLVAPNEFADAAVIELAEAIESETRTAQIGARAAGVADWVRAFEVVECARRVPRPATARPRTASQGADWRLFEPRSSRFASKLRTALEAELGGAGVLVYLPPFDGADHGVLGEPESSAIGSLLAGARAAFEGLDARTFVLVHHGHPGVAIARTLHQEARSLSTRVIELPEPAADGSSSEVDFVGGVLEEARAAAAFLEVRRDGEGARFERRLALAPPRAEREMPPLGRGDVVLVTGGGKGIAAECALALARETGCALALVGRAAPEDDPVLAEQLVRLEAARIRFAYRSADVGDREACATAVRVLSETLGPISVLVHGAGSNAPGSLSALDLAAFDETLRPKCAGLEHLLDALDPDALQQVVGFGSVIAELGLPGEAHYAYANERMAQQLRHFAQLHPDIRCVCLDWSIWSGVGMGERLGRVELLAARNITAITPEQGIDWMMRAMEGPPGFDRVFVSGRHGSPPTLQHAECDLPVWRFLEHVREHTPQVELVTEAELSHESDPYLLDHVHGGTPILPGVMGLEAMAQVAAALAGEEGVGRLEDIAFLQAVAVPEQATLRIRVAALRDEGGDVRVALRSESTGYAVDHMRATLRPGPTIDDAAAPDPPHPSEGAPIDDASPLYGPLFFHGGRFARVRGYRALHFDGCEARIATQAAPFFGGFHSSALLLGDPGARDAALHAIQACIPDRDLLPVSVQTIERLGELTAGDGQGGELVAEARERMRGGGEYRYDLSIRDARGGLLEAWRGLVLREVERPVGRGAPLLSLASPHLEERLSELLPFASVRLCLMPGVDREASEQAARRLHGRAARLLHRGDGKPIVAGERTLSISHAEDHTLACSGNAPALGCDLERVESRPAALWADLLGEERWLLAERIAAQTGESIDVAATRLWGALEALKKAGLPPGAPLVIESAIADEQAILAAGSIRVFTYPVGGGSPGEPRLMLTLCVDEPRRASGPGAAHGGDAIGGERALV